LSKSGSNIQHFNLGPNPAKRRSLGAFEPCRKTRSLDIRLIIFRSHVTSGIVVRIQRLNLRVGEMRSIQEPVTTVATTHQPKIARVAVSIVVQAIHFVDVLLIADRTVNHGARPQAYGPARAKAGRCSFRAAPVTKRSVGRGEMQHDSRPMRRCEPFVPDAVPGLNP